ncbi:MAG: AAA family ATPase [Rickettsiaceae bacterium]|nr:MAG: AAA family ATPase [Rickettsiaceae bacterium]
MNNNDLQWQASDPNISIWVSASAGTGKTKILTDRVLRLLLNHQQPEKILCLTFTNAAAQEMQNRINAKLESWALMREEALSTELESLLGRSGSTIEIAIAKTLYNKLLNSESKIELHTLHSYCQKILKRFPLEAGISPGFQVIDEIQAKNIISKVKNQIYLDKNCDATVKFFITNFHESTVDDIFDEIIQQRTKFQKFELEDGHNIYDQTITLKNSYECFENIKNLMKELITTFIEFALLFHKDIIDSCDLYSQQRILSFFLTKDGKKKKYIINKKIASDYPELLLRCINIQNKVYEFDQQQKTVKMLHYSYNLNNLAKILIFKYEIYKKNKSLLDYDDLIYCTNKLLNNRNNKDWILYKLDGGIEHLLIDEAQDTSDEQWEIIEAIISEFYSGDSARKEDRTIFVVGDEKQSIFSFQGADPNLIDQMNVKIQSRLNAAQKRYENINLEYSYRSSSAIIKVVYDVFEKIKNSDASLFIAKNLKIKAFRDKSYGRVELWPLISSSENSSLFWPTPSDFEHSSSCQQELAVKIAIFIKQLIDSGTILAATNLPAKFQDFMILVRKRDNFTKEIIDQLKKHSLETAGIDRMLLSQNISVMDLLSIAKFVLSPWDNLNLAALLKSPIIGLSDEILQDLIISNKSKILWQTLQQLSTNDHDQIRLTIKLKTWNSNLIVKKLSYFISLYQSSTISTFFSTIVDCLNYRKILVESNGMDSNDAIDELLYISLNYTYNGDYSLQGFICWFEANDIEIKRNFDVTDKIRVMTVHAAKGLQAPVVILCDTTTMPISKDKFFWTDEGQLLACQKSAHHPNIFKILKDEQQHKDIQEYIRLLYVGMTRAEDHLVICGYQSSMNIPENCWYKLVENSMKTLASNIINDVLIFEEENNQLSQYQVKLKDKEQIRENFEQKCNTICNANEESFYDNKTKQDVAKLADISTQQFEVISPILGYNFLKYGKIFHKILEDGLKSSNFNNIEFHPLLKGLTIPQRNKINKSIDHLLKNKEFSDLIQGEIKTEVSVGILENNKVKLGRIDLLIIQKNILTIVDYKSDLKPITSVSSIPENYIQQLKFYSQAVSKLYPDYDIQCKILWLQNGELMNL